MTFPRSIYPTMGTFGYCEVKVKRMKNARALFFLPIALLFLPTAYAATPTTGTGTILPGSVFTFTSTRMVDGNTILTVNELDHVAGAIGGSIAFSDSTLVILSTGNGIGFGTGSLTGSVMGRSGTITLSFTATFSGFPAAVQEEGRFVFLSGTGTDGLTNLQGQGTFEFTGATGTYSVIVMFT
jgi:hypothetical protein